MKIGITIVGILLVVLLGVYFMISRTPSSSIPTPTPTSPTPAPSPTPSVPSPVSVNISGFAFSSPEIQVKKGTKATWTNMDLSGHTVTSDTGAFESGNLSQGKTFSFTFNQTGTFSYHCSLHPHMMGKVIVE